MVIHQHYMPIDILWNLVYERVFVRVGVSDTRTRKGRYNVRGKRHVF